MTLAESIEKLKQIDGGEELVAAINSELSKVRNEAATHRVKATNASDALRQLAEHYGIDMSSGDLASAIASADARRQPKPGNVPEEVRAELDALRKTVEARENALKESENRRRRTLARSAAIEALNGANAVSPEDLSSLLVGRVQVGDGDAISWKADDGTFGDLQEGVRAWLTSRPDFVRSNQQAGPGGPSRKSLPGVATVTRADYEARKNDPGFLKELAAGKINIA